MKNHVLYELEKLGRMSGIYGMRIIQIIHKKLLKSLASAGVFVLQCLKRSHWEW